MSEGDWSATSIYFAYVYFCFKQVLHYNVKQSQSKIANCCSLMITKLPSKPGFQKEVCQR